MAYGLYLRVQGPCSSHVIEVVRLGLFHILDIHVLEWVALHMIILLRLLRRLSVIYYTCPSLEIQREDFFGRTEWFI